MRKLPLKRAASKNTELDSSPVGSDLHLWKAKDSLRALLNDERVPGGVRESLSQDFQSLEGMLAKLEHGHIHIAAFGRVSVGKSSLLNALMDEPHFYVSPLHGATQQSQMQPWREAEEGGIYFIDTPGINEIDGEIREKIAHEVSERSDLVLFVVEGDITDSELKALHQLARESRPMLLVLNKADRYTSNERSQLLFHISQRVQGVIDADNVIACSASPAERIYVEVDQSGVEREARRQPAPDIQALKDRLWVILESEGKTLAALNAGLFAGRLSDQIAERIALARREVADRIVRNYCLGKGIAVAINPVPVTDLVAAVALDISLVVHLSRVYALPVTKREAGSLIRVIIAQMAVLMGAIWGIHLVSSTLKIASAGISTALTAGTQAAVAYYATYVVGRAAERYFIKGKSWGKDGPKKVVQEILDSIDRDSILEQARKDIRIRLKGNKV